MEGGCGELPGGKGRGGTSRDGTAGNVWLARECGRATDTAGGSEVEGREELHVDWETDAAARYSLEDERERAVWAGCELAGNADGGSGEAAGIWREGSEG